ncbi:MAG: M56 family metallopeptidase [Bacteroidota bacterium]
MTFIIALLLKSSLILFFTLTVLLTLRKASASLRHWIASLCLASLLLLPVFQYFMPSIAVEMPAMESPELVAAADFLPESIQDVLANIPLEESISIPVSQQDMHELIPVKEQFATNDNTASTWQWNFSWKELLQWIWGIGFLCCLLRILLPILRLRKIVKVADESLVPDNLRQFAERENVQIYICSDFQTPMTFGFFRAKIVLPTEAISWSSKQLNMVLMHELAHIRRKDYLFHLIGLLTLGFYWFHPLVYLLQKWQQQEREKACDEYVLKQGIANTNYAESLIQVARNMLHKTSKRWDASLPMAATSETKKRVLAILKFDLNDWRFSTYLQWRWIGLFTCVLPLLAALHPRTKELLKEAVPQIEVVLEQPVFPLTVETDVQYPIKASQENLSTAQKETGILPDLTTLPIEEFHVSFGQQERTNRSIVAKLEKKSIRILKANAADEKRSFATWKEGNKTIEIWAKGSFETSERFPYFYNLEPNGLIVIRLMDNSNQKNRFQELVIQQAPFNGILAKKKSKLDRFPVSAGQTLYTFLSKNKIVNTTACFEYGGCFFENDWKERGDVIELWKKVMAQSIVEKIVREGASNVLKAVESGSENWEQKVRSSAQMALENFKAVEDTEWKKALHEFELSQLEIDPTTKKIKSKNHGFFSIQSPPNYTHIPSGTLLLKPPYAQKGAAQKETDQVSIPGFHLSKTEITNKQYRDFLLALERRGEKELLQAARIHHENWIIENHYNEPLAATYYRHPAFDNYPVVNISYEGAVAYCAWLTEIYNRAHANGEWKIQFRLPTKEEWMYAAKGEHQWGIYPWGSYEVRNGRGQYLANFKQIDEGQLKYNDSTSTYELVALYPGMAGDLNDRSLGPAPVHSYIPNDYGLYHMSGNVAEMLQAKGSTKGGSWNSTAYYIRIDAEDEYAGWERPSPFVGFRPVMVARKK